MEDGPGLGAQDLILAVFRLAVADYLGIWYGHDGPGPGKCMKVSLFRDDAQTFLCGPWAGYLSDLAGCSAHAIWREAQRLGVSRERLGHAA